MQPIIFPGAVQSETDLFGRGYQLDEIEQILIEQNTPAIVLGERRVGKTSFLNVILSRLQQRKGIQIVPLQVSPHGKTTLEEFASAMLSSLRDHKLREIESEAREAKNHMSVIHFIEEFEPAFKSLAKPNSKELFVVCVDEFDELIYKADQQHKITGLIHYLIERSALPIRFLFSMTSVPPSLKNQTASPFLSVSHLIQLPCLRPDDLVEMITHLTAGRLVWSNEDLVWLYEQFGGHPYFTKWLLSFLLLQPAVRSKSNLEPLPVTRELLLAAQKACFSDTNGRLAIENLLEMQFSDSEKDVIFTLAEQAEPLTIGQLRGANNLTWLTAARSLRERQYLEEERSCYHFRMAFMKSWLLQWERWDEQLNEHSGLRDNLQQPIEIELHASSRKVYAQGSLVPLSATEYQILIVLANHVGSVVTRDQIKDEVWKTQDGVNDQALDTTVSRLRKKLGNAGKQIETIHGQGFLLKRASIIDR